MLVSMSNSVLGSIFMKDGAVTTTPKKPRKKRHRNKLKNSSLRKKRPKKHIRNQKNNSFIFNYSKFNPESEKIMSNWYWTNYKKAMEWQNRHQVAHWKATALALFEENRYLLQIINNMQHSMVPNGSISEQALCKGGNLKKNKFKLNPAIIPESSIQKDDTDVEDDEAIEEENEDEDEDEDEEQQEGDENTNDDDFEIEMSEEMMQFFEESYKRKMDLEKLKEKELLKSAEEKVEQIKINKIKRTSEMNFLYGEGASMITGMETAVQLSFDKYCDSKSPKYWPNIPFRL